MYSILLSSSLAIEIDQNTWKNLVAAIQRDDRVFILQDTGEVVNLRPAPHIVLSARFQSARSKSLAARGFFECRYGEVHKFQEGCHCKSAGKEPEQFAIPEEVRQQIGLKTIAKTMTEPSYEENLRSRAESGEPRARNILSGKQ